MTAAVDAPQAHLLRRAEAEWLQQSAARLRTARARARDDHADRGDHADRARTHAGPALPLTGTEALR